MTPSFDPKCYDLAEAFLADVPDTNANDIRALAVSIQELIEDFISEHEKREEPNDRPTAA